MCAGNTLSSGKTGTVQKGGKNPIWTEKHDPTVALAFDVPAGTSVILRIVAWDEDDMKKHDLIGASSRV